MKGESYRGQNVQVTGYVPGQNIQKQALKVQSLHQRINNIRTDYINKTVNRIVKTKPSYITVEDLNISGMMKNRHLSKAVVSQKFYEFRTKLEQKCGENGIELRIVDRWFPSSKLCHSLNLRDAKTYKTA